jgi:hypothetical protein
VNCASSMDPAVRHRGQLDEAQHTCATRGTIIMIIQRWIAAVLLVGGLTGSVLADAAAQPPRPEVAIMAMQVSLQVLGYDPGPIDGLGGRRTVAALATYAQDRGITLNQVTVNLAVALLRAEVHEKLLNAGDTKDPGVAIPQGNLQTLPVYRW